MKYGETLRQRSIAAWSHYNIDYDDIKYFIKERTTPGKGKAVTVPGCPDKKLLDFQQELFVILEDQHQRIDLFVKSKVGEIQRRLDHAKKQVKQLSSRKSVAVDQRIPIGRLERYSRLENDLLKAGDEIRCLARFTSTQRTAFRKLLKKYKKWTGSSDLETRFREEILDHPKSFTKVEFRPLLDEYSLSLQTVRSLYENRVQGAKPSKEHLGYSLAAEPTPAQRLHASLSKNAKVDFDTAIATVPLGEAGVLANYFVHPENVVELQVLLLQHLDYYRPSSRSNSTSSPCSQSLSSEYCRQANYFMLVADNLDRFAQEQSALTVNDRELGPGLPPQREKVFIRWNNDDDAVLSVRTSPSETKLRPLKKKHIETLFDKTTTPAISRGVSFAEGDQTFAEVREEVSKDEKVRPLYRLSTYRTRFAGVDNGPQSIMLASLDTETAMHRADEDEDGATKSEFPFALLQVRQEGTNRSELFSILDRSHLLERVRGFSLQYHALWQTCKPKSIAPPFWMPILSRDIRKLPPPAIRGGSGMGAGSSGSRSVAQQSISRGSVTGMTDGTTAVETTDQSSIAVPDQLEVPPLRSFRKKRRRKYAASPERFHQRYWSEYDHPEDGQEAGNEYVLYLDPNERSTLDDIFRKVAALFGRRQEDDKEALLPSPTTPEDEHSSSDEDDVVNRRISSYGTVNASNSSRYRTPNQESKQPRRWCLPLFPQVTSVCFVASTAILVVAYVLTATSKHRYAAEVDASVLFAIACSLAFAVIGFIPLLKRGDGGWFPLSLGVIVLIIDAVCSGGLLAWMLG